ncbi:MAG: cobalamin biosynthesis protein, partial [Bacteroidaceae bacterium]|nr:cobalamin biosynthesis protein [Bacteroidaceae bacterium]
MLLSFFTLHSSFFILLALLLGWLLDLCFGDPARLPHPIVWFGKAIAACEHRFNRGAHRKLKGALVALTLILSTFLLTALLNYTLYIIHYTLFI